MTTNGKASAAPPVVAKTPPPQDAGIKIPRNLVPKAIREKIDNNPKDRILSDDYPYRDRMPTSLYEDKKAQLQVELLKAQHWVNESGQRVIMLFEGRDAAGKGGTIKRFMEHMNPRSARVVALSAPTERERGQWYFQRYIQQLPTKGEIVLFDRSWYNRAVVEPVMGFCTESEHHLFLREAPLVENMLIENGYYLMKFWFSVSREEQLRRFLSRAEDKLKQWKLSPVDMEGLSKWEAYTEAKKVMFMATDTKFAPWTVIRSDDKKRARLNCMRYVLSQLPYPNKDVAVIGEVDPKIVGPKEQIYHGDNW